MTKTARQLLDEALALCDAERLEIAAQLISSVDGPADKDWEEAWLAELQRRKAASAVREERAPEWSEVRARVLKQLNSP